MEKRSQTRYIPFSTPESGYSALARELWKQDSGGNSFLTIVEQSCECKENMRGFFAVPLHGTIQCSCALESGRVPPFRTAFSTV
jgi:hypothetical protein